MDWRLELWMIGDGERGVWRDLEMVKFYMSIGLGRRNDVLHSTMGLDGTGEISAFFSLVSFSVVGLFRAKHNRNRDTPFEKNKNRSRKRSLIQRAWCVCSFAFSLVGFIGWVEGRFTWLLLELRY